MNAPTNLVEVADKAVSSGLASLAELAKLAVNAADTHDQRLQLIDVYGQAVAAVVGSITGSYAAEEQE
jgi:hypothetical protein